MVDRAADLELMRLKLLGALGGAEPKELPSLCKELRAVDSELSQLAPEAEADPIDELIERRAARIAASKG